MAEHRLDVRHGAFLRGLLSAAPLAAALLLPSGDALEAAQSPEADDRPQSIAADSLPGGPYVDMRMLFEKTIFKVDVLTLHIRLNEADAREIERLVRGRRYSDQLADSVADVAIQSRDVWARIRFERNVSLGQFLDGTEDNLEKVHKAGIIDESDYDLISKGMPVWYAFLEERGILDGDLAYYRIRGDTLRTQYVGVEGEVLLDQTDVGPERRLAVLGSYFVRGSDFRKGLIKSLFSEGS